MVLRFSVSAFWATFLVVTLSACGARQYNGRLTKTSAPSAPSVMGPFYASGLGAKNALGANTMSTPGGGCASLTGRPCARVRASVGIPYQLDINSNSAVTAAGVGAGKSNTTKNGIENRDLHLMKGQTAPGEQSF